ncbi:succinate dehydrogenase assembly factor 2, mitochondrial-like isoform X1 [Rutidosis leptorrhynchoides]|uniref:succinate dehydrogenase assembly factor 2, mitochondrial-like isoform X1 n=1 Tax=Rutidosis leptorrhynchoides TaxID=125765 RepID=UPI003A990201
MASFKRALINVHRILNSTTVSARTITNTRASTLFRPQYYLVPRYFSSNSESLQIDLSNEESKRRLLNRLMYRSKQRGYLELDLVLGTWVEEHIQSMDENGIKSLLQVLDLVISSNDILENPDLWKWLSGQEQAPETVSVNPVFSALHENVRKNLDKHAAPETRATPGQPWVRGWDDIKKGRDGPVAGNQ